MRANIIIIIEVTQIVIDFFRVSPLCRKGTVAFTLPGTRSLWIIGYDRKNIGLGSVVNCDRSFPVEGGSKKPIHHKTQNSA